MCRKGVMECVSEFQMRSPSVLVLLGHTSFEMSASLGKNEVDTFWKTKINVLISNQKSYVAIMIELRESVFLLAEQL